MKRFSYQNSNIKKINELVLFPLKDLDISGLMINSRKKMAGVTVKNTRENYLYDLYAVVNHIGNISSGHFTCFCINENNDWLYYDDDRVFRLNKDVEKEIVTNKAYILFYKRQRFRSGNILKTMSLSG